MSLYPRSSGVPSVKSRSTVPLKDRLNARELIVGTFIKTPSPNVVEVLGLTALDCICLDGEHAPFDRGTLDVCILAARASGMDVLVRVPSTAPEHILNALDLGATGILVPHVRSEDEARALVQATHYGAGGRGFAGSSRASGYGTISMAQHKSNSRKQTVIIAQIEDPEAVEAVKAIAQVEGVDALFVGRVDLTVAYGAESLDDPQVVAAVERVCAAGRLHNRTVGMYLARPTDVPLWQSKGASLFLLGSDHSFLMSGAAALLEQIKPSDTRKEMAR